MLWIALTVISVALWGLADMISKKGTDLNDPHSHIRFVLCTGVAMLVFLPFFRLCSESGSSLIQLLKDYPGFLLITVSSASAIWKRLLPRRCATPPRRWSS